MSFLFVFVLPRFSKMDYQYVNEFDICVIDIIGVCVCVRRLVGVFEQGANKLCNIIHIFML